MLQLTATKEALRSKAGTKSKVWQYSWKEWWSKLKMLQIDFHYNDKYDTCIRSY